MSLWGAARAHCAELQTFPFPKHPPLFQSFLKDGQNSSCTPIHPQPPLQVPGSEHSTSPLLRCCPRSISRACPGLPLHISKSERATKSISCKPTAKDPEQSMEQVMRHKNAHFFFYYLHSSLIIVVGLEQHKSHLDEELSQPSLMRARQRLEQPEVSPQPSVCSSPCEQPQAELPPCSAQLTRLLLFSLLQIFQFLSGMSIVKCFLA